VEGSGGPGLKPWHLPVAVAGIAVPIIAATILAGPPGGLAAAFLVAATIVILAVRAAPRGPIEVVRAGRPGARLLVLAFTAVDAPPAVAAVADAATEADGGAEPEILVVAPATGSRLAHWLSDVEPARLAAQERLAVSLATLAAGGLDARGRVGDPDAVVAVEDALRVFPATHVLFVSDTDDERARAAAAEVGDRLALPVRHLELGPGQPARAPAR
jgi:hypothetical protein